MRGSSAKNIQPKTNIKRKEKGSARPEKNMPGTIQPILTYLYVLLFNFGRENVYAAVY